MTAFSITLRAIGGGIVLVALTHIALGPNADVLLGANLPADVINDPVLDSQNRFYGAAFGLYGVILILASYALDAYRPVLLWALALFFVAGLARLVCIALAGWPPTMVVVLLLLELLLPPVLVLWLRHLDAGTKN